MVHKNRHLDQQKTTERQKQTHIYGQLIKKKESWNNVGKVSQFIQLFQLRHLCVCVCLSLCVYINICMYI